MIAALTIAAVGLFLLTSGIVGGWIGNALHRLDIINAECEAERRQLVSKMNSPSQFTHHLPENASERRGDGEGISFHRPTTTTETDQ